MTPRTLRSKWKTLAFAEFPLPAAFGLLRKRVQASRNVFRGVDGLARVAKNVRVEHPRNRRLLDHLSIVAAVQAVEHIAYGAGLLDQIVQIDAGAMLAGR